MKKKAVKIKKRKYFTASRLFHKKNLWKNALAIPVLVVIIGVFLRVKNSAAVTHLAMV